MTDREIVADTSGEIVAGVEEDGDDVDNLGGRVKGDLVDVSNGEQVNSNSKFLFAGGSGKNGSWVVNPVDEAVRNAHG